MPVPPFVGDDYYCESGRYSEPVYQTIYWDDILWDGKQCGLLETDCCNFPLQPWFHKVLNKSSVDSIEIRMCIDQGTIDENILVSLCDIYIK